MNEKDFFDQFSYDPETDLLGSGGFGSVYRAAFLLFVSKAVALTVIN
jgi:hypothetical protein